ncbi:hypothetical protein MSG28_003794 [Choristoneura fumiferana]|uniref:Uncharacterized protein n=1 Tax=Choristoneura fumiferana TaxID=7141 RepID=A0ACC0KH98_CHOFU|nr:hypothetical protein MSG28_003794 [Choristoneura fumiferana]
MTLGRAPVLAVPSARDRDREERREVTLCGMKDLNFACSQENGWLMLPWLIISALMDILFALTAISMTTAISAHMSSPSTSLGMRRNVRVHVDHVVLQQQRAYGHAARRSTISTGTDPFTDLGLLGKKMCTRNDSFTDQGFHDKHIKVEGFIWGVATKVACILTLCYEELEEALSIALYVVRGDNMIAVVKWLDSKPIYVASTDAAVQPLPLGTCRRWSKQKEEYIEVKQPLSFWIPKASSRLPPPKLAHTHLMSCSESRAVPRTWLLSRNTKLRIYKTVVRPVLMYGCEAWTLTHKEEYQLLVAERKVLRKILGPVKRDDGSWRIRKKREIQELVAEPNIIGITKSHRLRWFGHLLRMGEDRAAERAYAGRTVSRRIIDVSTTTTGDVAVHDRDRWHALVSEAKTLFGSLSQIS